MRTRKIGRLDVTVVGLGCNNFGMRVDESATARVVDAAIDAGINLFDTADIYGGTKSEEYLGRALAGTKRDRVVLATKFGAPVSDELKGAAPAYVRTAAEACLRRLGTDRIDLLQLHVPDPSTPIGDTLTALDELVREGKVREIGCSNFGADLMSEAEAAADARGVGRFVSVQNHLNLLNRDPALGAAGVHGLAYLPFFPLASGMLTGKYRRNEAPPEGTRLAGFPEIRRGQVMSDATFDTVEALATFAADRGHTLVELAFQWLLAQGPVASVIAGATSPEQVAANAAAGTADWSLRAADLAEIDRITGAA